MMADAFVFADGLVKQLLTLATGSLGGLVVLFDNRDAAGVQLNGSFWLVAAIVLLAMSVAAGIVTLGSLTAELARTDGVPADANALEVRIPAMIQMVSFAAAVIATAVEMGRSISL